VTLADTVDLAQEPRRSTGLATGMLIVPPGLARLERGQNRTGRVHLDLVVSESACHCREINRGCLYLCRTFPSSDLVDGQSRSATGRYQSLGPNRQVNRVLRSAPAYHGLLLG